ncbi:MAG: hypothetical protein ACI84O_000974 [Myxococcota bacterium]|jgi:hypothetical protein
MYHYLKLLFAGCAASAVGLSTMSAQALVYDHSEPMFFDEKAAAKGVDSPGYGRGAAMVDLDNDGRLDLVVASAGTANEFYWQKGNGTFKRMNNLWSVPPEQGQSWGVIAADFDNDGDKDIYFPTGGFSGAEANVFLRNDLNVSGTFVDISASSGACALIVSNFGGSAFDYDNDGDLDLFLTSAVGPGTALLPCELYRNEGNMNFTDMAAPAGITHGGDFRHCGVADYDHDGYVDVMVGSFDSANLLYRNNGDGTFSEVASQAGVDDPYRSFGATFEDFNNDGWADVFVPKYQFTGTTPSSLFINNQDGTFRDITASANMTVQGDMGHNTGDINADGYPDIFIGTGHPYLERLDLVKMMFPVLNSDAMAAREAGGYMGLTAIGRSRAHGFAFGDIDDDGDIDVYGNNGGPSQISSSWGFNAFYYAQGNSSNWMKVLLEGVMSNSDAIGARIKVEASDGREIWRYPSAGKGFCNTDSPIQHFGLGTAASADLLEIYWPLGLIQTYVNMQTKDQHDLIETGIVFTGTPSVGGQVMINVVGPPNGEVEILYSPILAYNLDPIAHVVHRLGGTPSSKGISNLNANGRANIPFDFPNNPSISGTSVFVQARVVDVNNSSRITVKTNAIELAIP